MGETRWMRNSDGRITDEESWSENDEDSWGKHYMRRIIDEESWRRNRVGAMMEDASSMSNPSSFYQVPSIIHFNTSKLEHITLPPQDSSRGKHKHTHRLQ